MRQLLRRLGVDVVAYAPRNYPHLRRPLLLRELEIDLVVDGGASDGGWAERLREAGYSRRILSIEPLGSSYEELERRAARDTLWECRRVALAECPGAAELHIAANRQSSSLLPMLELHQRLAPNAYPAGSETVECARLDDLIGPSPGGVYLKLDLQGSELAALCGAERTLDSVRVIETELSAVPLYDGQPLLPEVIQFLQDRGFALIGLETSFRDRKTGDLAQMNGLLRRCEESA